MRENKTKSMIVCAFFAALIAVGAFLRIPIPVVPFTLQFLFTMMAGLLLGKRLGALSVLLYLAVGLAGAPVFAEGGGLTYILKPSFGYLIGFVVGSYITGALANDVPNPGMSRLLVANFAGLTVVYLFGLLYFFLISAFYLGNPIGLWPLLLYGLLLAIPGDIFLCILGALLGKRLIPILQANGV